MVHTTLRPDVLVAGRFRLERPLGQGGMGAVWRAHHETLHVPCALKFIHPHAASEEARERFEREARAAARLRSPNVVQVLDHGEWEGGPYIAMELLEGEDLRARLERQGMLDLPEVVSLAAQVGRALTKASALGLVHRDLKPANIFLVPDDDGDIAKVLDFGLAKAVGPLSSGDPRTETGVLLGTPFYMSPEQAQGVRELDGRSDLWSLAVIVFQCLTGQLPFEGPGLTDLLVSITHAPLPVPSEVAPVPPAFDAWWKKAAARDPAERFQTARELVEALAAALDVAPPKGLGDQSFEPTRSPHARSLEAPAQPTAVTRRVARSSSDAREPSAPAAAPAARWPLWAGGALALALGAGLARWWAAPATAQISPSALASGQPPGSNVARAPSAALEAVASVAPLATAPGLSSSASRAVLTGRAPRPSAPAGVPPTASNQPVGARCSQASQCTSGHCFDGVCCETACSDRCMACTVAKKQSGGKDGYCGFISGGFDPDRECGAGRVCDGIGVCVSKP